MRACVGRRRQGFQPQPSYARRPVRWLTTRVYGQAERRFAYPLSGLAMIRPGTPCAADRDAEIALMCRSIRRRGGFQGRSVSLGLRMLGYPGRRESAAAWRSGWVLEASRLGAAGRTCDEPSGPAALSGEADPAVRQHRGGRKRRYPRYPRSARLSCSPGEASRRAQDGWAHRSLPGVTCLLCRDALPPASRG